MKLVYGVGINDADYVVDKKKTTGYEDGKQKWCRLWMCPFYSVWKSMISRCYSQKFQSRKPTYIGCSVCEEWLTFSKFKSWMETQDWEGKQLDKDLLFPGNKIYSTETCVFISSDINNFILEKSNARGEWPIGVCWIGSIKKFKAGIRFSGKTEYLGYFYSAEEAHQAWLTRKLELAKLLASEQDDPKIAKALIERYKNYAKSLP